MFRRLFSTGGLLPAATARRRFCVFPDMGRISLNLSGSAGTNGGGVRRWGWPTGVLLRGFGETGPRSMEFQSVGRVCESLIAPRNHAPVQLTELQTLVDETYPRVFRAALVMTGNRWDAEDLAQETFLQAMRSWRRFGGHSSRETWLYAILLNLHRKRLRSARRRRQRWWRWIQRARRRPAEESPDGWVQSREWRESLWSAVSELPEPQQHAVVLRYSEGLTYEQIAEVMRCPTGTVKSRLHHALAALRKRLGAAEGATAAAKTAAAESREARR